MIKITFPDGSVREYAEGTTAYQIAESISPRLAADSLAASVNGATVSLLFFSPHHVSLTGDGFAYLPQLYA